MGGWYVFCVIEIHFYVKSLKLLKITLLYMKIFFPKPIGVLTPEILCLCHCQDSPVSVKTCMKYVQNFLEESFCTLLVSCVRSSHDTCAHAHVHSLEGTLATTLICITLNYLTLHYITLHHIT